MCDDDGLWVFMLLASLFFGGLVVGLVMSNIGSKPNTQSNFSTYKVTLASLNITVTEKALGYYNYQEVSFAEFLLVLKTANATDCYYDSGELFRAEKLWFLYDGIYYEVRK